MALYSVMAHARWSGQLHIVSWSPHLFCRQVISSCSSSYWCLRGRGLSVSLELFASFLALMLCVVRMFCRKKFVGIYGDGVHTLMEVAFKKYISIRALVA